MSKTIIEIQNLNFSYNGQPVLVDVNFNLQAGDFMVMIGPNGGGKTTLIKLMLGLLKADTGTVRIFGQSPQSVSHRIGRSYQQEFSGFRPGCGSDGQHKTGTGVVASFPAGPCRRDGSLKAGRNGRIWQSAHR